MAVARWRRSRRRGRAVRRLALSLIVLAVGWAAFGQLQGHLGPRSAAVLSAAPLEPAPADAPPYSSRFIRAGAPWTQQAISGVAADFAAVLNSADFPDSTAALLLDPRTGRPLYAHNADRPLTPASTIKLIVAATALHYLGPGYRFSTAIVSDGAPRGDELAGDVWLVGGGDPELLSDDLRAAARALKAAGIRRIRGNVYADGSAFGTEAANKTWLADDLPYGYAALPSAVSIGGGTAQFTITPDAGGGEAAVSIDPPQSAGRLSGAVATAPAWGANTLRIDALPDGSGFALSGSIPAGPPQKYWRSLEHPTLSAASALRALILQAGIAVDGVAAAAKAPAQSTELWRHSSRPLRDIIKRMTFDSDNHIAEQLLRAVGRQVYGIGTLPNGVAAERTFLKRLGLDDRAVVLADGSGLSTADRVTARVLGAVLRSMVAAQDAAASVDLLPRVGVDGTAKYRPVAADVIGKIVGKDGYIEGASGLAGYVKTAHHGVVVYALLVDGWHKGLDAVWRDEDDLLARLSRR